MERVPARMRIIGKMTQLVRQITLRHVLLAWIASALVVLGATNRALLGSEDFFLFLPLGAFVIVLFRSKTFSPRDWFLRKNRRNSLAALLFSALTLLMLPITRFLSGPMFSLEGMRIIWGNYAWQRSLHLAWNWVGLLGAVVLSVFGCWYALADLFLRSSRETVSPLTMEKPLVFGIYRGTLVIAAVSLVCIYSATPGLYDPFDSQSIWQNVADGFWYDWHTVTFQFFVKLCTLLIPSRRMISLVYWVCWTFLSNTAIGLLNPVLPHAGRRFALLSIAAFLPLMYLGTMYKDVAYSMALVCLSLQILRILQDTGRRGWRWAGMGFFAYCALAFRHEGIIPVLLTAFALLLYFRKKRRQLVRPLIFCVLAVFITHFAVTEVFAFRILDANRNKQYTAFGTPMYLLAAVVNSGCEIEPADQALLEQVMPLSDWAASQNPPNSLYTVDHVSREWGVPGTRISKVKRELGIRYCLLTAKYFFRYPGVMLNAFFTVNSLMWEITVPAAPDAAPGILSYDLAEINVQNESEVLFEFSFTGFAEITQRYAFFLETTPIFRDILVRGGIPFLSLIFGSYVLFRKHRRNEVLCTVPMFSAWLIQFALLCAQDARYTMPLCDWMVFYMLYAFAAPDVLHAGNVQDDPMQRA